MNLPLIELSETDILWLKTSVDLFLNNKPYGYTEALKQLWEKIPENYEPNEISHLLLYSGYQPTFYGIWHIYPDDSIFQDVDIVVNAIIKIFKEDPATEEVSTKDIAPRIELSETRVGIIFKLLGSLGQFYRSAASSGSFVGLDHIRFGYNETEIIQKYRAYKGIEKAIQDKIDEDNKSHKEYAAFENKYALEQINELIELSLSGRYNDKNRYQQIRSKMIKSTDLGLNIPEPIKECNTLSSLISRLQSESNYDDSEYQRTELEEDTVEIENSIDGELINGASVYIFEELSGIDIKALNNQWRKAYTRCNYDPDGAITAAKTLLESTMMIILDESNIEYKENSSTPSLYRLTSKVLNLDPSNRENGIVKKALGGCATLVNFLCEIRNEFGDAHGNASKVTIYPSQEIARLVISLSGHLSIWLLKRYKGRTLITH